MGAGRAFYSCIPGALPSGQDEPTRTFFRYFCLLSQLVASDFIPLLLGCFVMQCCFTLMLIGRCSRSVPRSIGHTEVLDKGYSCVAFPRITVPLPQGKYMDRRMTAG